MFKILLILLFVPIVLFSQIESKKAIIPDNIKIRLNEEQKNKFIEDLNEFMELKNEDFKKFVLVDSLNYFKYKDIFDELKFIELNTEIEDSSYYKPYLTNFIKQSENVFLISLSFRGKQGNLIEEKARITLLVKNKNGSFQFLNPFEFYTKNWNVKKIKDVYFHYRGKIQKNHAASFAHHNKFLAKLFDINPYPIKYFKCRDLQEAYQLLGLDYHVDINGIKRGCVTIPQINLFVSGTNKDEYVHDLTHYYFGLQIPKESRNWVAEEGYNINITDYWGYSTKDNYRFLRAFLKNNDVTALEIFEKNRIMRSPIPTKMPVAAVIMRKIKREYGMDGVMKIISCGNTDDDFFKAIEEVAGITKNNFNEVVENELKKE